LREAIQPIIRPGVRRRDRAAGILLLRMCDSIPRIVDIVGRGAVVECRFCSSVQRVARIGRHLVRRIVRVRSLRSVRQGHARPAAERVGYVDGTLRLAVISPDDSVRAGA
jgi:hypothetical protein